MMKLDVAADRKEEKRENETGIRKLALALAVVFGLSTMLTGVAVADDGIDLSEPAEAMADGECPTLIATKYPFLSCEAGVIGLAEGDATWENSRQIPMGSDFVEGNGYWGDDLNQD